MRQEINTVPPSAEDDSTARTAVAEPNRGLQPPNRWSRNDTNFWLDTALLIAFLFVLCTTAIAQLVFPSSADAAGWSLWGIDYSGWRMVQSVGIGAFAVLVVIHLILHWTWVCGIITSRLSRRLGRRVRVVEPMTTLYGVTFLAFCLFVIGAVFLVAEFRIVDNGAVMQ